MLIVQAKSNEEKKNKKLKKAGKNYNHLIEKFFPKELEQEDEEIKLAK